MKKNKKVIKNKKKIEASSKIDVNRILKILMTMLFIYLPFLDILRGTGFKDIEIFGIALIELVNFIILGISILLTFLKIDKRKFIKLFIYIGLVGIYIILHYYHIINFDTNIFARASFNFIKESYYIVRVYVLPILALFILLENRDIFNYKYYSKVLKVVIAFISFSIIILNLTKLSFSSYSAAHDPIQYSIIDHFFNKNVNYKMILSRGWFDSANEISAILFGLLPLNILMFFKEKKINNAILFIGQFAAMIILGTKTSATGAVLISYFGLVIYLFLTVIKRKKVEIKQVITFVVCLAVLTLFYYNSPFYLSRTHEIQVQEQLKVTAKEETILKDDKEDEKDKDDKQDKDDKEESTIKEEAKKEEQANFIMSNLYSYRINYVFTEIYPVKNDIEFWTRLSKRELYLNNDSRQMKIDILSRIKERNNNKLDNLFGLGYTLNFMDVERDYVYQFLLFGGLGVILFLGVYFIILGKSIVKCIFDLKKTICFDVALSFMAPCLMFVIAYLSGHVFGWVSPMMYISFVLGFLNHRVEENINES